MASILIDAGVKALLYGGAIVALSLVNLALVLHNTLGFLEAGILIDYATSSTHGRVTFVRLALAGVLVGLAFTPRRAWVGYLWAPAAMGLLATFSAISHNASMPGRLPVPADLVHLIAAVGWTSAVLAMAFLPVWHVDRRALLQRAMARVSTIGLTAVTMLVATGIYSAQLQRGGGEPEALVSTRYGWVLVVKVALVLAILALAARNRWHFLPALRLDGPTAAFTRTLRVEAVLLLAVIGATGLLTTSPMPH